MTRISISKVKKSIYADHFNLSTEWVINVNEHVSGYRKSLQDCLDWVYTYYKSDNINLSIDTRG